MLILILLTVTCFIGAFYYKRLIDQQTDAECLHGEVVSFETYRGWRGQDGWKYYEIIADANGRHYKIRTDNSKAKKYAKQREITFYVPVGAVGDEEFVGGQPAAQYSSNLLQGTQMQPVNGTARPTAVYLSEDRKKKWQFWFLIVAGICFAAITILFVIAALTSSH
ncbi:MAG: hypothetical protein MJ065_03410 [Oscillospiraceae bacterium]|nr:hypothetical protein [Oscillospiraceae bacterium]